MSFRPRHTPSAFRELGQLAVQVMTEVLTLLRGQLTWHYNHKIYEYEHTFTAVGADTEESIDISSLEIDWTPSYFVVLEVDDGAVVYPSNKGSWDSDTIKAKSTKVGTTVTVTVF